MSIEDDETTADPNADTAEIIAPATTPAQPQSPESMPSTTPEQVDVHKGGFH